MVNALEIRPVKNSGLLKIRHKISAPNKTAGTL
jgi:hypothetical protein